MSSYTHQKCHVGVSGGKATLLTGGEAPAPSPAQTVRQDYGQNGVETV